MMYKIYLDNKLMHTDNVPYLKIFDPTIELEQNKVGSFSFSIQNNHPYFYDIHKLKSLVEVYQENTLIFRGRVIEDGDDTYKVRKIYCEDELAFFIDSIQDPYTYEGSVRGLVEMLINNHNSQVEEYKQFKLGLVTVMDPNDFITRADSQYLNTWQSIQKKMIELLGGYIRIRHEDDGNYFDYLADLDTLNSQEIVFGENMLSVNRSQSGKDVYTVLVPLGAKVEGAEERLTIEDVNDGVKYLENAEGIKQYGRIKRVVTWDDVTLPENLKRKGLETLNESALMVSSIEISAIDMASIKKDIHAFKMYSKIHVISKFHGIDAYFVPLKMKISLFKPENNKISLNAVQKTLTDNTNGSLSDIGRVTETIVNIKNTQTSDQNKIIEVQKELTSSIEQTATSIHQEVSEKFYTKDETNDLVSELSTVFEQNKTYFEMQFSSFTQDLEDVLNGTNASFEDIRKFIRFEDGNIILGQIGNEFSLKITKERISFMQGVQEIAYVSNSKLYITLVEVLHTLQIGNFAFIPRANGNLTFKKI